MSKQSKFPSCFSQSACGGQAAPILVQGHKNPRRKLHPTLLDLTTNDKVTDHHTWLCTSSQEQLPDRGITHTNAKTSSRIGQNFKISTDFPGSQIEQQVETHPGSEYTEQTFKVREIQNGNTSKYKDFLPSRRMGNVHRFQGNLLSYPNKPTVQEIPTLSCSR